MRVELHRRVLKLEGRASLPCPRSVERWLTKTDGMSRNLETGGSHPDRRAPSPVQQRGFANRGRDRERARLGGGAMKSATADLAGDE